MSKFNAALAKGQGVQDQEIAKGVAWLDGSNPSAVYRLWTVLNDSDVHALRQLSAGELQVVCAVACVGFFEINKASLQK